MPNYYNQYPSFPPYNTPVVYPQPQQSFTQPASHNEVIKWVEGENAAKAFQLPSGWPANQYYPLWDSNDQVIYLKSVNPMGMPNPIQKLKYTIMNEELLQSGNASPDVDMSVYATKADFEQLKTEIHNILNKNSQQNNQNGSRGGKNGQPSV